MKHLTRFLLSAALLLPVALSAASFEGKVAMTMTMPKADPIPMTLSVKEGFSRTDTTMGKGVSASMIMDQAKQQIIILMPEQKMYMVQPMPKPEDFSEGKDAKSEVSFEKTGDTDKILGYSCTKYLVKYKDGHSEIWATDQLGTYLGTGGGGVGAQRSKNSPSYAWEKALIGKAFFPLRTIVYGKDGKEAVRTEATSVTKQSLPGSLFAAPADFQKFEMPPVGDMMKGMMKGLMKGGN
ncbi:MAG TPA: DUF4412 domain-containing protein [Opitutaceae bacterium]|nr:DUF4412 domain-containing protein [Opitutaceae bacterium]